MPEENLERYADGEFVRDILLEFGRTDLQRYPLKDLVRGIVSMENLKVMDRYSILPQTPDTECYRVTLDQNLQRLYKEIDRREKL